MTNKFSTILCCVFSALLANVSLSCDSVTVSSLPSLPWLTMFNEPDQMPAVITVTRASSHSTKRQTSKIFLRNIKDFWCLLLYKLSSFSGLNFVINSLVIVVEDIWYFHSSLSEMSDGWVFGLIVLTNVSIFQYQTRQDSCPHIFQIFQFQ